MCVIKSVKSPNGAGKLKKMTKKENKTSWSEDASWYDALLEEGKDTYQKELILPNLSRLLDIKKGERVLDVGCGQGYFSRAVSKEGAVVVGVDISRELISLARTHGGENIQYIVGSAEKLPLAEEVAFDKAIIVLALQNIEGAQVALKEITSRLVIGGKLFMVLNHPGFRIPKESDWYFDEEKKEQGRVVYRYLGEAKQKILMHPSEKGGGSVTYSFHRPLQFYVKSLAKSGFLVSGLEEWNSHKKSSSGPRQKAEDFARKEIPLFMCIEATKQ